VFDCGGDGIPDTDCDCAGNVDDCAGVCGGSAEVDECGDCGGGGIADGACDCDGNVDLGCGCGEAGPSGCDNACGSSAVDDECGVCNGGGFSELCGGQAGNNPGDLCDSNDSSSDCTCSVVGPCGICNVSTYTYPCDVGEWDDSAGQITGCCVNECDDCGVCGGDNTSCQCEWPYVHNCHTQTQQPVIWPAESSHSPTSHGYVYVDTLHIPHGPTTEQVQSEEESLLSHKSPGLFPAWPPHNSA
jgi:hypothetical protein